MLVTSLAGWDPALCEWLAPLTLQQLIEPRKYLEEFAGYRKWKLDEQRTPKKAWPLGLTYTFGGKRTPHTCVAALLNGSRDLQKLIWRAEIGVLMPYIEEQREILLQQYRNLLNVNFLTKSGDWIENIYDLEIGLIHFQLSQRSSLSPKEIKWVADLKDARNNLSHLEPLVPELLSALCSGAKRSAT